MNFKNLKWIGILTFLAFFLFLMPLINAESVIINPTGCSDTEGNCMLGNVQVQDNVSESQEGHDNAWRGITTEHDDPSAVSLTNPSQEIKQVWAYVDRYESTGADGSIVIEVRRVSDAVATTCTLITKLVEDDVYDSCNVTCLILGGLCPDGTTKTASSIPEADAESLDVTYKIQALGAEEYMYLDHSYVNITYTDLYPPVINLGNPVNDTWVNYTTNITFFFTPNDVTSGIANCTLIIDGTYNQTNTSAIIENQENNITTTLVEGIHTWTVNCTDTSSNNNEGTNSSLKTINVDVTEPSLINLTAPIDNFNTTSNNVTFNFIVIDNLASSLNCSLYINSTLNQTNSSTLNNTVTAFNVTGFLHGDYQWNITCLDKALNSNWSETRSFFVNRTPALTSISDSPDPIKGGSVITITGVGVDDPNNDTLYLYCSEYSNTPDSTNTNCTGGNTTDTSPPYSLTCTYATPADDTTHEVYCRVYDGESYSLVSSTNYTTDSTPPTTSINNVAGDPEATYYDNVNDGVTNITIDGEANMACRYATADLAYSDMSNDCTISGTQAICSPVTTVEGLDAYNFYVSCKDSLGNEQNASQNLDITSLVTDWTAPTTSDNSSVAVQLPNYTVTITESDNLFSSASITTLYCTDTVGNCTPSISIDDGGTITFTSTNRGTNFLRYYSKDPAENNQTVQNKTININQLPIFTSATDNATIIKGGSTVLITTVSSDLDSGQTLKLFVCNSTSVNSSGCGGKTYCSNTTGSANSTCSFGAETDDATHNWYAFIYDSLNESATSNYSGSYTTDSTSPDIVIIDPDNTTYPSTSVPAAITLSEPGSLGWYCLDGCISNVSMSNSTPTYWYATITVSLNGSYTVIFWANDTYGNLGTNSTSFSVDTTINDTIAPTINVLSPTNESYNSTTVLANITLSEPGSWAGYCLDNCSVNQTMGNTSLTNWNYTLTNLSEQLHQIIFYANDTSFNKNTGSAIIYFTVDATPPQYIVYNNTPTSPKDNESVTCYSYWTDNLLIDYIIVEENATGTAKNHTVNILNASGYGNYTINASTLNPGDVQCRFYANDTTGNLNSTSLIFTVTDVTPPVIKNITYLPNKTAELDPGARVNVTANVTDYVQVTSVILQYKLSNASSWNNYTMSNISSDIYEGNFTPTTGNWTFRINTTDLAGNWNLSSEYNLSVEYDRTWDKITTIPSVKSIVQDQPRVFDLGNLTVNNTGDYNLNFTVYANVSWVTFNGTGNNSISFTVNFSNSTTFNVTANTIGFAVGEYSYGITLNSSLNGTFISSETIIGKVVIQNVAGPYLVVSIDTYDATVIQGQIGITLIASVKNLGTADATNVWLAWSLPSGWLNTSGILNRSIDFLGVGENASNTIIVSISSSAATGTKTINAYANCTEGSFGSDSKSVTVSAVEEEVTPPVISGIPAPPAAAPIYAPTPEEKELLLQSAETFELVRGLDDTFPIKVTNPFANTTLENVTLSVTGYLSQYMEITPDMLTGIKYNETKEFKIIITAPAYMEKGTYSLNFTITGVILADNKTTPMTENRIVTLIIHEVGKEEANISLTKAEKDLQDMLNSKLPANRVKKLLSDAKEALKDKDYEKVKELAEQIAVIKQKAFTAKDLIQDIRNKIKQAEEEGLPVKETKNLLNLALAAFEREDFATAQQRAKDAQLIFLLETKGVINLVKFVLDYWWAIAIGIVIASFASLMLYRRLIVIRIGRKLKDLNVEEMNITDLMKEAQRKTYKEKTMSMLTYHKTMYDYEKRLSEIKQTRARLRTKRIGIIKPINELENLKKESQDIDELMKRAQDDYYNKGIIARGTYAKKMEQYKIRKTEIDASIAMLEAKLAKKKRLKKIKLRKIPVKRIKLPSLRIYRLKSALTKIKPKVRKVVEKPKEIKKVEVKPEVKKELKKPIKQHLKEFLESIKPKEPLKERLSRTIRSLKKAKPKVTKKERVKVVKGEEPKKEVPIEKKERIEIKPFIPTRRQRYDYMRAQKWIPYRNVILYNIAKGFGELKRRLKRRLE